MTTKSARWLPWQARTLNHALEPSVTRFHSLLHASGTLDPPHYEPGPFEHLQVLRNVKPSRSTAFGTIPKTDGNPNV